MTTEPHPLRAFSRKWGPIMAIVCGAILLLLWNNAGPVSVQVSGVQFVEGQTRVQAGPLQVNVNGRVSIRVEPASPADDIELLASSSRYSLPNQLTGSTVHLSVHLGSATVVDHQGTKVTLGPGEQRSFAPAP